MTSPLLEACIDSSAQAVLARQHGAHRVELCAHLEWDGLTPYPDSLAQAIALAEIPVMAMIRCRKGDFVYSSDELATMVQSAREVRLAGAAGVVFGALTPEGKIDLAALDQIADAAYPLPLTFHKAIDYTPDPFSTLNELVRHGRTATVLSSGGPGLAWDNRVLLRQMVAYGKAHKLTVLVAGGVRWDNLEALHAIVDATAYHGRKIVPNLF